MPGVIGGASDALPVGWLLGPFAFPTDYAAGNFPDPYTEAGATGSLVTQATTGAISVSGGVALFDYASTTYAPALVSTDAIDLADGVGGIVYITKTEWVAGSISRMITLNNTQTHNRNSSELALTANGGGTLQQAYQPFNTYTPPAFSLPANNHYLALVCDDQLNAVQYWVSADGIDWELYWVGENTQNLTTLYASVGAANGDCKAELMGVISLPSNGYDVWAGQAMAKVNASPAVASTTYTGYANALAYQKITAPAVLAGSAGIKVRATDDNNCWHAYFDDAGAFKVDKLVANSPDGSSPYVNEAAVIAGGETKTIGVIQDGTTLRFFVDTDQQGSDQADSTYQANSAAIPVADASWTGGGGSLGNLKIYPRDAADEATGAAQTSLAAIAAVA